MQPQIHETIPVEPRTVGTYPGAKIFGDARVRLMMALSVGMISLHFLLWAGIVLTRGRSWTELLTGWDSGWYLKIVQEGYTGQAWAFYPAWPLLLKFLNGFGLHPVIFGTFLATILYFGILALFAFMMRDAEAFEKQGLLPTRQIGWFLLIFSPASFAFHSNHTESLYLFLSLAAWIACVHERWLLAAVACGLAALTKNQGVLLAVSCALWVASMKPSLSKKVTRFLWFGLVSGSFFALFPLYQWLETGDPLRFLTVQSAWHPDISWASYFKGLVIQNPWQALSVGTLIHHVFFLVLLVGGGLLWRQNKFLSLYVFLFVLIEPMSGELVGTLRYGTVLVPVFFALSKVWRGPFMFPALALWLALNLAVTWNYGIGRWAY